MDFEKLQTWWRKKSSFLRLKIHEELPGGEPKIHDMGRLLLKEIHAENTAVPPQVLQGMWQAYGQMRAARTTARATVIATGILGAGLFFYQQRLKEKAEERQKALELKEEELEDKKAEFIQSTQIAEGYEKETEAHRAVWNAICGERSEFNKFSSEQCDIVKGLFKQAFEKVSQEKIITLSSNDLQRNTRR